MTANPEQKLIEEELTFSVIGAMQEVHRELGFGYRERIYTLALERVLIAKGHHVERDVGVMVYFRGQPLARQVLDMVVDRKVLVEVKATEHLHSSGTLQLFSYLCSTKLEIGLLLHFGRQPRAHRVICENRLKRR
jgi:GxxExxY protein